MSGRSSRKGGGRRGAGTQRVLAVVAACVVALSMQRAEGVMGATPAAENGERPAAAASADGENATAVAPESAAEENRDGTGSSASSPLLGTGVDLRRLEEMGVTDPSDLLVAHSAGCMATNLSAVVRTRLLLICQMLPLLNECLGVEANEPLLSYHDCSGEECEQEYTYEETTCLGSAWGIDLTGKNKSIETTECGVPVADDDLLEWSKTAFTLPVTTNNDGAFGTDGGGDCFYSLPTRCDILIKVNCFDGLPAMTSKIVFPESLGPGPFDCAVSARCFENGDFEEECLCWQQPGASNGGVFDRALTFQRWGWWLSFLTTAVMLLPLL